MTIYNTDSFNRVDSTTNLGSTDGAGTLDPKTWTQSAGTWGINTNAAYTSASAANAIAQFDSTNANVTVTVALSTITANVSGLVFRFSDTSNYWRFTLTNAGVWALTKIVATAATSVAGSTVTGAANGDVLKVVANGSTLTVFRNGVQLATATDAFNSSATRHGLYNNSNTTERFDNFSVGNPEVIVALTHTETPTVPSTVTARLRTITLTQTETPTVTRNRTTAKTVSVTQAEFPTDPADLIPGHVTSASGPEDNPTYAIHVVNMQGNNPVSLPNAEPDSVTWTLDQPDEFEFHFPKNAYANTDVMVLGTAATGPREIQIYRNGDLLTWGPVIGLQAAGNTGEVTCHGAGVDWYLNRRFVDGPIPNSLTNADFESGTGSWTANSGAGLTFTVDTGNFETGAQSAKLVVTSPNADSHIRQSVGAGPNALGLLLTLSGWYYIDSFTAPAFGFLGLYMEGSKNGVFQDNNWYPIDSATPRGAWTKASTTLWIPPNDVWNITVKAYGPQGTIHWDDLKLVAMNSLSTAGITGSVNAPVDMSEIFRLLINHEQASSHGKSNLNIGGTFATTGVKLAKTWQYVDHVQYDQAIRELLDRNDGADYSMDYTPNTRTFHSYAHKRGVDRHASVTLLYDPTQSTSNCTDYRLTMDGGQCITRAVVLGEDNGPDREQGEAVDATAIGGITLQEVRQSPQGTKTASLQPLANERLARYKNVPLTIELDVPGGTGLIPTLNCGDIVTVGVSDGWTEVLSPSYRIMKMKLDCKTNILTVTVSADTLT